MNSILKKMGAKTAIVSFIFTIISAIGSVRYHNSPNEFLVISLAVCLGASAVVSFAAISTIVERINKVKNEMRKEMHEHEKTKLTEMD